MTNHRSLVPKQILPKVMTTFGPGPRPTYVFPHLLDQTGSSGDGGRPGPWDPHPDWDLLLGILTFPFLVPLRGIGRRRRLGNPVALPRGCVLTIWGPPAHDG